MASLEHYLDECLAQGRSYFVGDEARSALGVSRRNFAAAVTRLINKGRLANPRHGFFLILRPEDRIAGAPDQNGHCAWLASPPNVERPVGDVNRNERLSTLAPRLATP